jgi:hypothetical protein
MSQPDVNPYASPRTGEDGAPPARLDGPIVLRGIVGLDLHLRAHQLARGKIRMGWQLPVAFVVVGLMGCVVTAQNLRDGRPLGLWPAILLAFPLVFAFVWLMLTRSGAWHLKRAFARGDLKPQEASWTITDDGIHAVTDTIDSKEKWANYESWRASDDLILLYGRGQTIYIPLAHEFCQSEADWHRLREFLHEKLPEKKA